MGTAILLASVIVAAIISMALFMYTFLLVSNFFSDEAKAMAEGKVTRAAWRKRSALLISASSIAFFGLLVLTIYGVQSVTERLLHKVGDARQARYEACLERTTAEVCEIHWVQLPKSDSDVGTELVITPDGKIGMGLGL